MVAYGGQNRGKEYRTSRGKRTARFADAGRNCIKSLEASVLKFVPFVQSWHRLKRPYGQGREAYGLIRAAHELVQWSVQIAGAHLQTVIITVKDGTKTRKQGKAIAMQP